ncbi:MAG: ion transporter [Piscirickettsiaceae bacterium CG_4_9_14_3_um_filter_43_564]|nr:ion transporter [Thiomicrospira sp.]OIP95053.1 MAG: ion transporter [Thiomicrospira sp. CG2_30_44_34]PIQ04115.1 MAG: ion transporter [Piscirickettsiaceae bacterium CG18_big_fil_WC_8_21_14_2_50_44_103]PIU38775.1 MAG: ion transporter [Piscirickettsiaceae bacterium CG07_land_8_20_14_0_80_44_28]PIW58689.1 MAG: ion transporter [Piscirickettsiaceae bacterium CG12_big_fil_rev_8_21_14_0_65_44_934]PIW76964.1 MAG: ion transporter [Piscirickettsiaceae bacterium CG_4_8_14_3_um_filter_44_38]PIX80344.1 
MATSAFQVKFQAIRDNKAFELFVITIIILSSLMIGAKTYPLPEALVSVLWVMDYAVTLFFLIEILIRMAAEGHLSHFFKKGWNIFDFVIVVVSLIPLDDAEYALIARMLRLFRVMRLISFIPELRVLVTALITALPRMGYVALLMFIIFYLYAVVGSLLFGQINPVLWGDLGISLLTLFRVATFEDWTDVMYETMAVYSLSWIYYLTFIFFSAFVFLNMMIGIVVEVLDEEHKKMQIEQEGDLQAEAIANQDELAHQVADLHRKLDVLLAAQQNPGGKR